MDYVLEQLRARLVAGETVAVGTVVATVDSAPRPAGTSMLVTAAGEVIGSISGGCIDGAVYDTALDAILTGHASVTRYGLSDGDAYTVGITCGGTIDIFVQRYMPENLPVIDRVVSDVAAGRAVATVVVVEHPHADMIGRHLIVRPDCLNRAHEGMIANPERDAGIARDAHGMLASGRTGILEYGWNGDQMCAGVRLFVRSYVPPPRLIVLGAIDFARAITRVAKVLGFAVTVCDARPVFATAARFPEADDVVVRWPHRYLADEQRAGRIDERTVICVLTHDPKFDVPALEIGLRLPKVAYVGAMGSRRTHEDRTFRLRQVGITTAELARLRSPIGLDIGARTPEETAISILGEVIADRWGRPATPLGKSSGPIHTHDRIRNHSAESFGVTE